jgi:hypothetical protein
LPTIQPKIHPTLVVPAASEQTPWHPTVNDGSESLDTLTIESKKQINYKKAVIAAGSAFGLFLVGISLHRANGLKKASQVGLELFEQERRPSTVSAVIPEVARPTLSSIPMPIPPTQYRLAKWYNESRPIRWFINITAPLSLVMNIGGSMVAQKLFNVTAENKSLKEKLFALSPIEMNPFGSV